MHFEPLAHIAARSHKPTLDVTVIMPAFNRGALISRALDSLLNQTCWPREVIVIDDASKDDTAEQAAMWGRKHQFPVRVERLERNGGAAAARNHGMRVARTTYIAFLDSDDEHFPHTLERLVHAFDAVPDAVVAFGDATKIMPSETIRNAMFLRRADPARISERVAASASNLYRLLDAKSLLLPASIIPTCATCFRREDALAVGGMPQAYRTGEDWLFWLRLTERGSFVFYPEDLAIVHRHPDNLTHPENARHTARHKILGFRAILDGSAGFSTTEAQRITIDRLIDRRVTEWRYGLSRLGLRSYVSGLREGAEFTGRGALFHLARDPKSIARALAYSLIARKTFNPD